MSGPAIHIDDQGVRCELAGGKVEQVTWDGLERLDFVGQPACATRRVAYKIAFRQGRVGAGVVRGIDVADAAEDAAVVAAYAEVSRHRDPAWAAARDREKGRQAAFLRE